MKELYTLAGLNLYGGGGAMGAEQLWRMMGICSYYQTSKHLKALAKFGFVKRQGNLYSITHLGVKTVDAVWNEVHSHLKEAYENA